MNSFKYIGEYTVQTDKIEFAPETLLKSTKCHYMINFLGSMSQLKFQNIVRFRSLIATKVETNMCLVSLKLFIVRTILCATIQTYTTYTTIITTITIRSLFLSAYNLFASHTCSLYAVPLKTFL